MIRINNLQKNFGTKKAVDIENYTIGQGDMLGLVGNNGAGKTTLFRLILDLLQADRGNVTINDIDVSKSEDWKNFTGAFIDDGFLIDYLTPEEYFYFIGKMYGLKKEEVDERLLPFERFMNGEVMGQKKFIRNYSAGNKQKIGIISAMLHHPQLLILDEPFNFLDPSSQSVIKHLLKRYNEEHGATVIISSHNLNHTVDVCPRIALLENGVIIRDIRNENNSAEQELEAYFNVGVEEEAVVEETVVEAAVEEITEKEDKTVDAYVCHFFAGSTAGEEHQISLTQVAAGDFTALFQLPVCASRQTGVVNFLIQLRYQSGAVRSTFAVATCAIGGAYPFGGMDV